MKNIYDIFEQRKNDSLNCSFNNVLESCNDIICFCNMFENDCYYDLEESFDFKEMKNKMKKGIKTIGSSIGEFINKIIEYLKKLAKDLKIWFKNIKRRFGKKDLQDVIDEKIENVLDNDDKKETNGEQNNIKTQSTDFNKKKNISDAEKNYRTNKSNERRLDKNRKVSLKEILYFGKDKKIKVAKLLSFKELSNNADEILKNILGYINSHDRDIEKGEIIEDNVLIYLKKLGKIDTENISSVEKAILKGSGEPHETTIGDLYDVIISYSHMGIIYDYIENYEKIIDKTIDRTISRLEKFAQKYNDDEEYSSSLRSDVNHLANATNLIIKVVSKVSDVMNTHFNACYKMVTYIVDIYIKEVLK